MYCVCVQIVPDWLGSNYSRNYFMSYRAPFGGDSLQAADTKYKVSQSVSPLTQHPTRTIPHQGIRSALNLTWRDVT